MPRLSPLSIQLYSVREPLADDVSGTLARLAQMGLTRVEPYNIVQNTQELKKAIVDNGLSAPTAHQHFVGGDDLSAAFEAAQELGIETVIEPMVRGEQWASRDGLKSIVDELTAAADLAASRGMRVGYHNHAFEFENLLDGATAYEVFVGLLDPRVVLELDTYWAMMGGQDVPALLQRLGDRVIALHLKDGLRAGTTADQLPLGQGDLPVHAIVDAAGPVEYPVLEFDQYAGDIFDGVAASYAFAIQSLGAER